jgi:hypothetical protein
MMDKIGREKKFEDRVVIFYSWWMKLSHDKSGGCVD